MARIELPFLRVDRDRHGVTRYYFRRSGRSIRLRHPPGSDQFMAAYREALAETAPAEKAASGPQTQTLKWLGFRFRESGEFKRLDATSQRLKWNVLVACFDEPLAQGSNAKMGDCPLSVFGPQHVKVLRDRKADKLGASKNRLKHLGTLFSWAVANGEAKFNPVRDIKALKYASDGYYTWTVDEVRQFAECHPPGTKACLALALLFCTGQRRQDVVKFGPQHVRHGVLQYIPTKTLLRKVEPVIFKMPPELEQIISMSPIGTTTFLRTEYGLPFTDKGFSNWFKDRCKEAGLPHCSAHGLRKALATAAADSGASEHQLMALLGWSDAKMASRYTRRANRKRLADAASAGVSEARTAALFGPDCPTFGLDDCPTARIS